MTDVLTSHDIEEGELREGWLLSTIGEQCEVVAGSTPKSAVGEYWGGDIAWLTPKDLSQDRSQFVEHGERSITKSGYESCSTRLVPAGSVLFTSRAPIGYVAIAANEMCTNQGFKTAVPGSGLQSEFLYWQLQHVTPDIRSRASGTTFPEISGKGFAATEIVVPQLEEQERIVEILEDQLSHLDTALQSVHTVREKAAQFRRSLLHAAFTGALTGHDVEEGELPSGWSLCQFSEIANVDSNLVDPKPLGHLPHIAPNNIESDSGRLLQYRSTAEDGVTSGKHKFQRGHILYSKIRPYLNKVVVVDFEGLCSADMYPISTDQNISWLWMAMLSPSFVSQTSSTQTRTVLPKINIKELSRIEIPVPPLLEQERIVEILEDQLSRLDASLAVADAVEERSAELRRSLLHSAFTGRLTRVWREAVNV